MPKGFNKDGSPKLRPEGSGRKKKPPEERKIPCGWSLAPDVVGIIRRQDRQAAFIEGLVREWENKK